MKILRGNQSEIFGKVFFYLSFCLTLIVPYICCDLCERKIHLMCDAVLCLTKYQKISAQHSQLSHQSLNVCMYLFEQIINWSLRVINFAPLGYIRNIAAAPQ